MTSARSRTRRRTSTGLIMSVSALSQMLARLRRQLRILLFVRGACLTLAMVATLLTLTALVDWLFPIPAAPLRFAILLSVLTLGGWMLFVRVWRPLSGNWSDHALALLVEHLKPDCRDRLASAIQFAQSDIASESQTATIPLQTIQDAEQVIKRFSPREILDLGAVLRALAACFSSLAVIVLLFVVSPSLASVGFTRTLFPLSAGPWPRETVLVLLDEDLQTLASHSASCLAGQPFHLYVMNLRGAVPEDLSVWVRQGKAPPVSLPVTRTSLRDPSGQERELAVITLKPTLDGLQIRAAGGDDRTMPWHTIPVLPLPQIESFDIEITPPSYTKLPVEQLTRRVGHVTGLVGSTVQIRARCNTPLESVVWHHHDGTQADVTLSDDGLEFTTSFSIDSPGRSSYWFDLTDQQGHTLAHPQRYEILGKADAVPRVELILPERDLSVTPLAQIPIQVQCEDDLGLKQVDLVFEISATTQRKPLWTADQTEPAGLSWEQTTPWHLENLSVQPGESIRYHIETRDHHPDESHFGQSEQRMLIVISPDEKRAELISAEAGLAKMIQRLLARQKEQQTRTRDLITQWSIVHQFQDEDLDSLRFAELERQRILGDLANPNSGLLEQIETIQQEWEWNRISDQTGADHLQRLHQQTAGLISEQFPRLGQDLAAVRRLSQPGDEKDSVVSAPPLEHQTDIDAVLANVDRTQVSITTTFEAMLAELGESQHRNDTIRELEDLFAAQQEIHDETETISSSTLGRSLADLSDQDRARLSILANRQRDLKQIFEDLQAETNKPDTIPPLSPNPPRQVEEFHPLQTLQARNLEENIEQAARHLETNRLGQAEQTQRKILDLLKSTVDQAVASQANDPETLLRTLRQARSETETLRKRQLDLLSQSRSLGPVSESPEARQRLEILRKEQQALAEQTEQLTIRLERRKFDDAAASAARATSQMQQAASILEQDRPESALGQQQAAINTLDQLQSNLADAENQTAQQQAQDTILHLPEQLKKLRDQQKQIRQQTMDLEKIKQTAGRLNRSALRTLQTLISGQRDLHQQALDIKQKTAPQRILDQQIQRISTAMATALAKLESRETGQVVQEYQQTAIGRLDLLLESLNTKPDPNQKPKNVPGAAPPSENSDQFLDTIQLRLVLSLQNDLLKRTEQLRKRMRQDPDNPTWKQQKLQIAEEQQELAEALNTLLFGKDETNK